MVPSNTLIALFLLTSPPGSVEPSEALVLHAHAPLVRFLAVHWQVLDAREQHVLQNAEDFAADLKILQSRVQELAGAPFVEEAARFPERGLASDYLACNRAYRESLKARLDLDGLHAADLNAALEEAERLFRVWDTVREVRCEYCFVTVRRQALQQLRELLGVHHFCSGTLPPHLPLWRLPEY